MQEVGVLATALLVEGRVLHMIGLTKTLSRVLAMSKGLQTVTEIRPATSPDTK